MTLSSSWVEIKIQMFNWANPAPQSKVFLKGSTAEEDGTEWTKFHLVMSHFTSSVSSWCSGNLFPYRGFLIMCNQFLSGVLASCLLCVRSCVSQHAVMLGTHSHGTIVQKDSVCEISKTWGNFLNVCIYEGHFLGSSVNDSHRGTGCQVRAAWGISLPTILR